VDMSVEPAALARAVTKSRISKPRLVKASWDSMTMLGVMQTAGIRDLFTLRNLTNYLSRGQLPL
jgi:hypothetical protein